MNNLHKRYFAQLLLVFVLLFSTVSKATIYKVQRYHLKSGHTSLGMFSLVFKPNEQGVYNSKQIHKLIFHPDRDVDIQNWGKESTRWNHLGGWLHNLSTAPVSSELLESDNHLDARLKLMLGDHLASGDIFDYFISVEGMNYMGINVLPGVLVQFKNTEKESLSVLHEGMSFHSTSSDGLVEFSDSDKQYKIRLGNLIGGSNHLPVLTYMGEMGEENTKVACELWAHHCQGNDYTDVVKRKLEYMQDLNQGGNSKSIPLICHFLLSHNLFSDYDFMQGELTMEFNPIFAQSDSTLIVEEYADYGVREFLKGEIDIPKNNISPMLLLIEIAEIFVQLKMRGILFNGRLYDFLICRSETGFTVKYTGHERMCDDNPAINCDAEELFISVINESKLVTWSGGSEHNEALLAAFLNALPSGAIKLFPLVLTYLRYYTQEDNQNIPLNQNFYKDIVMDQLKEAGLTTVNTPNDGFCLIHAVFNVDKADLQKVIAEINSMIEQNVNDPVFAEHLHNEVALLVSGAWASPSLLSVMATILQQPIVLIYPGLGNTDSFLSIHMHDGTLPTQGHDLSLVLQQLSVNYQPIVIGHDGVNHYFGTTAATEESSHAVEPTAEGTGSIGIMKKSWPSEDAVLPSPKLAENDISTYLSALPTFLYMLIVKINRDNAKVGF